MKRKLNFIILIISILLVGLLISNLVLDVIHLEKNYKEDILYSKHRLECDENGKFKVLILADVHANGTLPDDVKNNIETLVNKEQPNLVPKVVFAETFDGQKVQLGIFVVSAIESKAKTPLAFQRHKQRVFPIKLASVHVNLCANLATRVCF